VTPDLYGEGRTADTRAVARAVIDAAAAELAWDRTLDFLRRAVV
jgi:dienelactone hydrolase